MLRIVDRYLIREILGPFLLTLLTFTFILEIPFITKLAPELIAKGVNWMTIGQIMVTLLPATLGLTIPMGLLVGLLIGLGRLSGDRETVALQACGVSVVRMLRPVAFLALAGWAATSWVMIDALPAANQEYREITYRIVAERAENEVKPGIFFDTFPNVVLYVRQVQPGAGWKEVFVTDTTRPAEPRTYVAASGRLVLDRPQRRVEIVLENGTQHIPDANDPAKYQLTRFENVRLNLDPDSVFPRAGIPKGDRELTIPELRKEIESYKRTGQSPHNLIMEIQKKFSIPVACLVFAVIGLALGVTTRRDGKMASFVLGVGVIFVYYIVMYMAESLTKGGFLPAEWAMWMPNVVLGTAGIALLYWRSHLAERRFVLPALPWTRGSCATSAETGPSQATQGHRVVLVVRIPDVFMPRPHILDRYIAGNYARMVGLGFVGMLGIFYISTFIDLSDKLFKGQATGWMLLQFFWFATPQYIYYVLPISALIGTLVTIGLLTKSSELVVMKACGISLYRAAVPLLLFGVLWSGVLFALEETILAPANRRAEALSNTIRGGPPRIVDVLNRRWILGRDGNIYHYAFYDPARRELNGLSIYHFQEGSWHLARRTFATRAAFDGLWHAQGGWEREFDAQGRPVKYDPFSTRDIALEPPDYFVTERPDAERMTYAQLNRYIAELKASGFNVIEHAVALQKKLSFPFVTIIMTLIGVPFAVTTGRRGAMYGIGLGLVLAMVYWVAMSVFGAIGSAGVVTPLLAAWAPNILFAACATYMLLTVRT